MIVQNLQKYKCPTLMFHLYRKRFLKLYEEGKIVKNLFFKENDKFNPGGLLCDTWAQITGKGKWDTDCRFNFETTSGSRAWAHSDPPLPVTSSCIKLNNRNCGASLFIGASRFNDPEVIKAFLDRVEEFEPCNTKEESVDWWEVHYWDEYAGQDLPELHKILVQAESCAQAHDQFKKMHPTGIIQRTIFVPKTVF